MSSQYEGGGTKTVSMFSKLVSQGSSFVMEGVKNLVVKKHVSSVYSLRPRNIRPNNPTKIIFFSAHKITELNKSLTS